MNDEFFEKVNTPIRRVYRNENVNKKPILFMLVGLPGSGKSVLANEIYVQRDAITKPVVCSSDALRKELYGNENSQEHNNELFIELHKRIKDLLCNGKDVIYDATNINKRRRVQFLKELKYIDCSKVCVTLMTPYEACKENDEKRSRVVGESVVRKMYMNWCPPDYNEGFDDIVLAYHYPSDGIRNKFTLENFFGGEINADNISQDNKHHTYTIGQHCRAAADYIKEHYPNDEALYNAGLLHDIGKVFTKSELNSKGEKDGDCHYYQHHCVGAYDSMFYTDVMELPLQQRIKIANLIYYHMKPFTSWKQSEKAKNRDVALIGCDMYQSVLHLHEADLAAH